MTTPGTPPLCESCAHLALPDDSPGYHCTAFPDGIPDAIYVDGFDHRNPYDGDSGIVYQLAPGREALLMLRRYEAV